MRRLRIVSALILCAYAAWCSRFWRGTQEAIAHAGEDYAALRTLLAFDRVPILEIARQLDAVRPPDAPVALSPPLLRNGALQQRLSEGLYPRRTDQRAPDLLVLARDGSVASPTSDPTRPPPPPAASPWSFSFDLVGLVTAAGALVGFGALVRRDAPGAVLAGAGIVGAIVTLETIVQAGVPWWSLRLAGWACLAYVLWRRRIEPVRLSPEAWLLVALLALLAFRMAVLPVTGWDGRSVWLFHAKQMFFGRGMALADLTHSDWEWSHPVYPLLMPGVMALFGGGNAVFNERIAVLALPVVWAAALAILWGLVRETAGRVEGAAIAIAIFFVLEGLVGDLYMDGLVAVLLAIVMLALAREETRGMAIVAASVVALVKVEGAVAAGIAMTVRFVLDRRPFPWRLSWLAPLVLPLAHRAWLSLNHVTEFQAQVDVAGVVGGLPHRLPVLLGGIPALLARETTGQQAETQALLRMGCAGLVAGIAMLAARRHQSRPFRVTLLGGSVLVVLALALTAAMPQEASWLVTWTLDRLLAHPAAAFAILPFL